MTKRLRWLILFGAPVLVGVVNLTHPVFFQPTGVYNAILNQVDWWITLHILNLALFALLGLAAYLLIKEQRSLAAAISKVAIAVYVPFYAGFDALVGIGTGILVKHASSLSPELLRPVEGAIDAFWSSGVAYTLAAIGSIAWIIAILAAVVAFTAPGRRRLMAVLVILTFLVGGASQSLALGSFPWWATIIVPSLVLFAAGQPRLPALCLSLAAGLFGTTHVVPYGPLGMLCFFVAAAYVELIAIRPAESEMVVSPTMAS
jgi:hypothetical protein